MKQLIARLKSLLRGFIFNKRKKIERTRTYGLSEELYTLMKIIYNIIHVQ